MQGFTGTTRHRVTKKKKKRMKMISESCLERAKRKKVLMYSRLKAT